MRDALDLAAFLDNWVVWAILLLGIVCYGLLFELLLSPRDPDWYRRLTTWLKALPVLLSALPLLGLLGTIGGLLSTFREMGLDSNLDPEAFLSSGIADALITTQLGLVLVIPGWLLLSCLKARFKSTPLPTPGQEKTA